MRFPASFLVDIRARAPISTVVGRRVAWDRKKTNAGRGDYWACCPFHGEKTPSFHVEDKKGRYHCFGCKVSGDIFTFLVEKEGLSFPEAVERLAQEAGLPLPVVSEAQEESEQKRASLYDIMEMAAAFFEAELQSARGARARGYLADRQIPPAVQAQFRLGYAPDDRSALRRHLADKGATVDDMAAAGLIVTGEDIPVAYDRFRDRIMFPIRDTRGRVIAFGGRALAQDVPAKYLNSPETPLFHKGRILYNLDQARGPAHSAGQVIAVEGYIDVIAMCRAGLAQAVAPLGTALTADQLGLLWRMAPEPVLCFDGDAAGLKAAYRALDLALPLLKPGHSLRFAFLPEGRDPDDLLTAEGPEAVRAVVEKALPLAETLWQRALAGNDRATPERRAQFERDLRRLVQGIGDEGVRRHYFADIEERLRALWPTGGDRRKTMRPRLPRLRAIRKGEEPWDAPLPASPQLKALARRMDPATAHERRERLILLTLLNHPPLLDEFADSFAHLEFSVRVLDSLRRELLDVAALRAGLDRDALKDHFISRGFGPELARLETQAKRLNEWFLSAGAALDDARTGLSQMIALHRKHVTLVRELKAAEARFAAEPTEANLTHLNEVREQLNSAEGREAAIPGFGDASGRPADLLT
jgi:DNA primase